MTYKDVVQEITQRTGLSQKDVDAVLDTQRDIVTREMGIEGGEVPLPGLGKFKHKRRAARTGRNPKTGESIQIAAKNVVDFTAAKGIKEAINA